MIQRVYVYVSFFSNQFLHRQFRSLDFLGHVLSKLMSEQGSWAGHHGPKQLGLGLKPKR